MTGLPSGARGFAFAADAYAKARPGYPKEAVDYVTQALGISALSTVLDLGAGTGKLTHALSLTGARVIAIEPIHEMRVRLRESLPNLPIVGGFAEAIPLADECLDAVTVAQAFHWFRLAEAVSEIARVLRPGGGLAILWNVRDETTGWVAKLSGLLDRYDSGTPRFQADRWASVTRGTGLDGHLVERHFLHEQWMDVDSVLERVASIHFVALLEPDARDQLFAQIRTMLRDDGKVGESQRFRLPYRASVYLSFRRG